MERFQRLRRQHLPWTWHGGGGACDERVGRFCLTYGGGDDRDPPPEPEPVVEARDTLVAALAAVSGRIPGDGWLWGQRTRYLVEAERAAEAEVALAGCAAERWWCAALTGYALHADGRYLEAEAAFGEALGAMPARQRERWTDVRKLLTADESRGYRRLPPEEQERWRERFWWLSDPLWLVPGNERLTEHYARHAVAATVGRSEPNSGFSWGDDLEELVLRYGWFSSWERVRASGPGLGATEVVSHFPPHSAGFHPPGRAVADPPALRVEDWRPDDERARSTYAPRYARDFDALPHQIAIFRRGDSAVVVGAYDLDVTRLADGAQVEAALLAASDAGAAVHREVRRSGAPTDAIFGALGLRLPALPVVVSLEALVHGESRALRARTGLSLAPLAPGERALSDLLLLRAVDPLPDSLSAAVLAARGSARVRSGETFAVYWEMYNLEEEELRIAVAMEREEGWLRRTGERLGLLRQEVPVRVRWREGADRGVASRSLLLQLPRTAPGRYTLIVTVDGSGVEPLEARRRLEVLP